jgi:flagellar basal body rod protein FlgG
MLRALWTAGQGMMAQQLNVDVISNNLANVNTTGFKKERLEFKDLLYETFTRADSDGVGGGRPVNLQVGHGVRAVASVKNYRTGNLQKTERPLDFALEGDGFFKVQISNGQFAYTRDGSFKVSVTEQGSVLTTSEGFSVLDQNDNRIVLPKGINVNDLVGSAEGLLSYLGVTSQFLKGQIRQGFVLDLKDPQTDPLGIFELLPEEIQDQIEEETYRVDDDFLSVINEVVIKNQNFVDEIPVNLDEIKHEGIGFLLERRQKNLISEEESEKLNLMLLKYFHGENIPKNTDDPEIIPLDVTFGVVNFKNRYGLESIGNNFFRETVASGQAISNNLATRQTRVAQSFLESSNVQIVEEMVDLIVAQRAYEINSKSIQTADDMLNTANNLKR